MRDLRRSPASVLPRSALLTIAAALGCGGTPLLAQKTDVVTLNNGDDVTGEVKELQYGQMKYSTDAMGTVYVEWPKIVTLETKDKIFEVELSDGTKYFGTLRKGAEPNQTRVIVDRDTLTVATQSVVRLSRIKKTVWDRIDGNVNLGFDFTQENDKLDFTIASQVTYTSGLSNILWNLNTTLSRQEGAADISKLNTTVAYVREFGHKWFWTGLGAAETNTQLSLDVRGTAGVGLGRFMVQTNKVVLGIAAGGGYSREKFTGEDPDNLAEAFLMTEFRYFSWGNLDTTLTSQLMVTPVLNQSGRVRLGFDTSFNREIVNNFNFNLSLQETFDSQPQSTTAAKNDITLSTGFGWSF